MVPFKMQNNAGIIEMLKWLTWAKRDKMDTKVKFRHKEQKLAKYAETSNNKKCTQTKIAKNVWNLKALCEKCRNQLVKAWWYAEFPGKAHF